MSKDPDVYLKRQKKDIPNKWFKPLKEFSKEARLNIAEKTVYDYLTRLKSILKRFCDQSFDLDNPRSYGVYINIYMH